MERSSSARALARDRGRWSEWRRARLLQERAIAEGFDWPNLAAVFEKVQEELAELREAVREGQGIEDEFGDVLLVLGRLALMLDVDPERALGQARRKFTRRYTRYRRLLAAHHDSPNIPDPELSQTLWDRVKEEERRLLRGERTR